MPLFYSRLPIGFAAVSSIISRVSSCGFVQRGLLEIPRELPGVVGVLVIAALSGCGNVTLAMISFCLYGLGMFVLGVLSPGYLLMQLFVFVYSLGDHLTMPIRDALAMDLADEGRRAPFWENTAATQRWVPWQRPCLFLSVSGTDFSGSVREKGSCRPFAWHLSLLR